MKYSNYKISLDIHDGSAQAVVRVKRGDTARRILAVLTENGMPYHITDECTAVFTATKPDGNVMYNDCMIEGCIIIYTLTEQTSAVCGVLNCEFKLYGANGDMLTCPAFSIIVDDTVYHDGDEVESTPEYTALTQKMSEVTSLIYEVERKLENGEFVGEPGITPKKGVDYWTPEEQKEISDAAQAAITAAGEANAAAVGAITAAGNANDAANAANSSADAASAAAGNANDAADAANASAKKVEDAVAAANTATEAANTAAKDANTAAGNAAAAQVSTNLATSAANKAAENANTAANAANSAAGDASAAAGAANTAANSATAAANSANAAAGKVGSAIQNANDAAGRADTAIQDANTAAGVANSAASKANTAANGADTAAGNANGAANAASSAADAANAAAQSAAKAEENLKAAAERGEFDGDPFTYEDFTPEQLAALKGPKGDPGQTPERGSDYWTAEDIAEIKSYVDDAILGGAW